MVTLTRSALGNLTLSPAGAGSGTHGRGGGGSGTNDRGGGGQPNTDDTWQLQKVREICNNRCTSTGIHGAVVTSIKIKKPSTGGQKIVDGVMQCKRDAAGSEEIECSFMVVKSEAYARNVFQCAISVQHRRCAKAYFYGYLESLEAYVVCFERLKPFEQSDNKDSLSDEKKRRTQKQPKVRWLHVIREMFEYLEALNKAGYAHLQLSKASNFVYAANLPSSKDGNDVKELKIINATTFPEQANKTESDKLILSQHAEFLRFLEDNGANDLTEYESFKHLVERSVDLKTILNHPFLLESTKERTTCISFVNEILCGLKMQELENVNDQLKDEFPNLDWKKTVRENRRMFGTFSTDTKPYGEGFDGLSKFLRNFVEHERDNAPHHHVNYDKLEKVISELFPQVVSWLYTYVHCQARVLV